jgi:sporulation protein YlmC with PRC-barrel domain
MKGDGLLLHFSTAAVARRIALGAALGVFCWPILAAQDEGRGADRDAVSNEALDAAQLRFARFNDVQGGSVSGPGGQELGRVQDLVIDRGSGDIRYLVLDRGGVLGVGGSARAIPWSHVSVAAGDQTPGEKPGALVARITPEQLDRMPEFDAADHSAVQSQSWIEALRSAVSDWTDWSDHDRADPHAGVLESAAMTTIEGKIAHVRRDRDFEVAEQIVVEVARSSGRVAVALGPSWYIMGTAHPPMRGAEITIEAFELEREGGIAAVARSFTIEGAEIELRGEDGSARWAEAPSAEDDAQEDDRRSRGHLVLGSDIVGASATAHGKDAGEIKRLVIEQTTGVVAFVEIDPDANFLGLAESTRLVPWEALMTVGAARVRLDASPQTLTTAPQSPQRAEVARWFADESNRDRIYKLFQFEPRRFKSKSGGL